MALKETSIIITGVVIIVVISSILNLLLNISIILSILIAIIIAIFISLLISKPTIRTILGIIAWGLIVFAVIAVILKWLGVVNSPPITELLLTGILAELLRLETKFKDFHVRLNLLWSDFRKRKEI